MDRRLPPIPNGLATAREASSDELHRVRNNPDVWITNDERIIYIREMEDDHIVNTLVFMRGRDAELMAMARKFIGIVRLRWNRMEKEALKRGLMPKVMLKVGDVRGLVKATKELHSKPDFTKTVATEESRLLREYRDGPE